MIGTLCRRSPGKGVQPVIAEKLKYRAVNPVSSRLGYYVHQASGHAAIQCVVVVCLNIELLQRTGVRQNVSRVAKAGHIKTAVEVVTDRSYKVVRAAVDIYNLLRVAQYIAACAVLHAWREGEQIIYVASDNGEIVDLGVINYAAEAECGGLYEARSIRNRDGFGGAAKRQSYVIGELIVETKRDIGLRISLKPCASTFSSYLPIGRYSSR
jgi:hypothetical protein